MPVSDYFELISINDINKILVGQVNGEDIYVDSPIVALAPVGEILFSLVKNNKMLLKDYEKIVFYVFQPEDKGNFDDNYDEVDKALFDMANNLMEDEDYDDNTTLFIVRYPIKHSPDISEINNAITELNERELSIIPDESDSDYLTFFYTGNHIGYTLLNELVLKTAREENEEKSHLINYYVSFMSSQIIAGQVTQKMNSVIVNHEGLIDSPEAIVELRDSIAKEMDKDKDDILVVAFSYMGPVIQNNNTQEDDNFCVARIVYKQNGEEKEYTSVTDVDITDPQYDGYGLPESIIRDLPDVTEDDEIEILFVDKIGDGSTL